MRYLLSLLLLISLSIPTFACSMFCFQVDGKTLVGNNEDYFDPDTWMWTHKGGKYSSVFFGFGNFFAQGGMNEAGLVFDGFAMEAREVKDTKGKKSLSAAKLVQKIMSSCSTVAEVEEIMRKYDLSFMLNAQLMFVDKSGASLVVEGDDFLRKEKDYQITTNFYQSSTPKDEFHAVCDRYAKGDILMSQGVEYSIDYAKKVLDAMHSEGFWGGTQYSNIYDLEENKIYLYLFHNFGEAVELSLDEVIKKGGRIQLKDLFEDKEPYMAFAEGYQKSLEMVNALGEHKDLDNLKKDVQALENIPQAQIWYQQILEAANEFQEAERHKMAIVVIGMAKNIFPPNWRIHAMHAKSLFLQKQIKEAEQEIDQALELNPNEPELLAAKEKIKAAKEK
ncbi:MAG: linear amide C-N hydrolase [Bacteroidota bacterium]